MPKVAKRILITFVAVFALMIHSGIMEQGLPQDEGFHTWQASPEGILFRFHWASIGVAMLALCQWVWAARKKKPKKNENNPESHS